MRPEWRIRTADPGYQYKVVFRGLCDTGKTLGDLFLMQNALQCLEERTVALLALQPERFFQQVALLEVIDQKVKEVDVGHTKTGPGLRQMIQEEPDVFADVQFILRSIIEDVKGNLIANAAGFEEIVRCELRKDLVEPMGQRGGLMVERRCSGARIFRPACAGNPALPWQYGPFAT